MGARIVGDDHIELRLERANKRKEIELYFLFLVEDCFVWGGAIVEDTILIGKLDDRILVLSKSQLQKVFDLAPAWDGDWQILYRHHTVPFLPIEEILIQGSKLDKMASMLEILNKVFVTVFPDLEFKI